MIKPDSRVLEFPEPGIVISTMTIAEITEACNRLGLVEVPSGSIIGAAYAAYRSGVEITPFSRATYYWDNQGRMIGTLAERNAEVFPRFTKTTYAYNEAGCLALSCTGGDDKLGRFELHLVRIYEYPDGLPFDKYHETLYNSFNPEGHQWNKFTDGGVHY